MRWAWCRSIYREFYLGRARATKGNPLVLVVALLGAAVGWINALLIAFLMPGYSNRDGFFAAQPIRRMTAPVRVTVGLLITLGLATDAAAFGDLTAPQHGAVLFDLSAVPLLAAAVVALGHVRLTGGAGGEIYLSALAHRRGRSAGLFAMAADLDSTKLATSTLVLHAKAPDGRQERLQGLYRALGFTAPDPKRPAWMRREPQARPPAAESNGADPGL